MRTGIKRRKQKMRKQKERKNKKNLIVVVFLAFVTFFTSCHYNLVFFVTTACAVFASSHQNRLHCHPLPFVIFPLLTLSFIINIDVALCKLWFCKGFQGRSTHDHSRYLDHTRIMVKAHPRSHLKRYHIRTHERNRKSHCIRIPRKKILVVVELGITRILDDNSILVVVVFQQRWQANLMRWTLPQPF